MCLLSLWYAFLCFLFSLKTRNQQLCQSKVGPFRVWAVEKSTDFFSEKKEAKKHKEAFALFSFYCKSFSLNRIPLFSWTHFTIFAWFPLNTFFFVSKIKNSLLSFFIISCFFISIFTILQTFYKTISDRPQFFLQKKVLQRFFQNVLSLNFSEYFFEHEC